MLLSCATQSMIRYLLFRKLIRLAYQTSDLISVPNLPEDIASDWLITNLDTVYTHALIFLDLLWMLSVTVLWLKSQVPVTRKPLLPTLCNYPYTETRNLVDVPWQPDRFTVCYILKACDA